MVCTANICRSVMAESFLRVLAAERDIEIELSSCGILFDDEPASETVIELLAERGIDVAAHRSRKFAPAMLDDIDLVITMERMQARELAITSEGSSSRIHTLGALSEWLASDSDVAGTPQERIAAFAATRRPADLLGGGSDEVADPHGRSKRLHRKTAERLDVLCAQLLVGLYGPDE